MHVVPDGRVFMSGPNTLTQFLTTSGETGWSFLKPGDFNGSLRSNMIQDYAPSVMYADGKILYVGGGIPPSNAAQVLDLNQSNPTWRATKFSMSIGRRHHNATILPDGTVLVTGGTSGSGGPEGGFNDLSKPVKTAELWDPATEEWTVLAAEDTPRCYHGTAVLLPDARVFARGVASTTPPVNRGTRTIRRTATWTRRSSSLLTCSVVARGLSSPALRPTVTYNQTFTVGTSQPQNVGQVNWVRLFLRHPRLQPGPADQLPEVHRDCDGPLGNGAERSQYLPTRPLHAVRAGREQGSIGRQNHQDPMIDRGQAWVINHLLRPNPVAAHRPGRHPHTGIHSPQ